MVQGNWQSLPNGMRQFYCFGENTFEYTEFRGHIENKKTSGLANFIFTGNSLMTGQPGRMISITYVFSKSNYSDLKNDDRTWAGVADALYATSPVVN